MDLAKQSKSSFNFKGARYLIYFPGLWLTIHLVRLSISERGFSSTAAIWQNFENDQILIQEFFKYRNIFYVLYIGIFILLGLVVFYKGIKSANNKQTRIKSLNLSRSSDNNKLINDKNSLLSQIFPASVLGLIFVTYSFALAKIIVSLLVYLWSII